MRRVSGPNCVYTCFTVDGVLNTSLSRRAVCLDGQEEASRARRDVRPSVCGQAEGGGGSVMCVVRGMFVQRGVCLPRCRTYGGQV